jgi:hypothetical protein
MNAVRLAVASKTGILQGVELKYPHQPALSLTLPSEGPFVPVAVAYAENAGKAFAFGSREIYCLALSTEEIFTYLSRVLGPGQHVDIQVQHGLYFLGLRFLFRPSQLNLRVFNLTAKTPLDGGQGLDELGLFAVSRMVDSLRLTSEPDGRMGLTVLVERIYQEKTTPCNQPIPVACNWTVSPAGREEIQFFASLVTAHYPAWQYPGFLKFPGKMADMIASGDWQAALAVGESGAVSGGVLWTWMSERLIEMVGPFLFPQNQPSGMAAALVEHVIEWTAKTKAVGLFCRRDSNQSIPPGFELLGQTTAPAHGGRKPFENYAYRQMHEDTGTTVFGHPALQDFLRQDYERLILPRELRVIPFQGTSMGENAVLTCDYSKVRSQATLRGLCFGSDAVPVLQEHLVQFQDQNLQTVLFEMDLGIPWHSAFVPALLETGFVPRMIVPYAGKADTAIFQKE